MPSRIVSPSADEQATQQTAAMLAKNMRDTQAGKMTPDQYRAFVREHRPNFSASEWQQIQFAAAARDSRNVTP